MKKKLYECEECLREVVLRSTIKSGEKKGKKVCSGCYNRILRPLEKSSKKVRKEEDDCLQRYFEYHVSIAYKSEESWIALGNGKANICHIFPKRNHESIKCEKENAVYLTIDEHSLFDRLLDSHDWDELEKQFPNCWPDVCSRAKSLLPKIEESTKFKTLFSEYLKRV